MTKKAAVYARYSSDNQREESIDAQLRSIEDYAKRNNIIIAKIYIDRAKTATSDRRPEFLNMIADSDKGMFNTVIVHKLDRFSRNKYDSSKYKRKLKLNSVQLLSVTENIDGSPESIIMESLLEGMAEYYSKNLAREVMKGMKETAYQCRHTGGLPPIGYSVDPISKKYLINDEERPIIEIIFSMYISGYGYNQIVTTLNERGFKSRYGRPIGKNTIHEILKNEKYTGVYLFNLTDGKDANGKRNTNRKKEVGEVIRIENGMPSIVSKEDFQKVQEKLNRNKKRAGSYTAKEVYLLSGLIYCGDCEKKHDKEFSMVGNVKYCGRNKNKYVTYRCGNKDRTKDCAGKEIRREYIENYVIDQLEANIFSESAIPVLVDQVHKQIRTLDIDIEKEVMSLQKKLNETNKQIKNIVEAIAQGFTQNSFMNKMDHLEQLKVKCEAKIIELKNRSRGKEITPDILRTLIRKFKSYVAENNIPEIKKFINSYVDKVIVYPKHVEVIYKLQIVDSSNSESPQHDAVVGLHNGGEGSRTPVRRQRHISFYGCSDSFVVTQSSSPSPDLKRVSLIIFFRRPQAETEAAYPTTC